MQIQKYKDTNAKISSGLVDGHTHPVWAGDRVHEFAMKLAGASYMEVLYSIYMPYIWQFSGLAISYFTVSFLNYERSFVQLSFRSLALGKTEG